MRQSSASDPEAVIAHLRVQLDHVQDDIAAILRSLDDIAVQAAPPSATLLTVEEVAQLLRVSRTRVFELLAAHELDGVMLGRRRLVPRKSVEALLSGRPVRARPFCAPRCRGSKALGSGSSGPLAELIAEAEHSLLGSNLFLVAAGASHEGIEPVLVYGPYQGDRLQPVATRLRAGLLWSPSGASGPILKKLITLVIFC